MTVFRATKRLANRVCDACHGYVIADPGCLQDPDNRRLVHMIGPGVFVDATPPARCEWEGCDRVAATGQDLCTAHMDQWKAENQNQRDMAW